MIAFLLVLAGAVCLSAWVTIADVLLTELADRMFWFQRALERDAEDKRLGRVPVPLSTSVAVASFEVPDDPDPCAVCGQPDCCASHGDNRGTLEAKEAIAARQAKHLGSMADRMDALAIQVQAELDRVPTPAEIDAAITNAQAWLDRRDWGDGEP